LAKIHPSKLAKDYSISSRSVINSFQQKYNREILVSRYVAISFALQLRETLKI
jgi:hypothetical protein